MSGDAYRKAGVDIEEGNRLVPMIKELVKKTHRPEVLAGIGGFSAMVTIPKGIKKPVLVSGTDGVGTKLKLAFMAKRYDTIGIDLVAMCVNDVLVLGAEPLFFLDYFATGKLSADTAALVVKGIAEGCAQAGCALVGGETAEMPDFYPPGEFDLAGFSVGVVDKDKIIDGSKVKAGDVLIGIPSSGVHSNGYSLVRRILFTQQKLKINTRIPELGATVADAFLKPTIIYAKLIKKLLKKVPVKGMVHITGGGFYDNIPRVVPEKLAVEIGGDFTIPPLFQWLKKAGGVSEHEMFTVFNCGVGFVCVVDKKHAAEAAKLTGGHIIGTVVKRARGPVIFKKKYF
ncbi:MAG TPA: phosphoribosylformylglycinamidine cyclo-ligase [bacterium]|nr:phosphoribosylformylglycinamidine cyclo-ligase [bacterium]